MTKIEMNIEGMHCGACATGIQMIAEGMDGVSSAFVSYDDKLGTFELDESQVSAEQIIEEIKKLGYSATVKS